MIPSIPFDPTDLKPTVRALSEVLLWAGSLVTGPYLFLRGFRVLQLKHFIMNVPKSSIRAAALGPVELSGKAVGPYTLLAPITKTECLCYWLATGIGPASNWERVCAPLFLDDDTGTLMVSPEALKVSLYPTFAGEIREYVIRPGDEIFVLGTLQENPWAKKNPDLKRSELSRIGPGFVSKSEADLLWAQALPFLDSTFPNPEASTDSAREFDLHPPTILMKGKGLFVISTESQRTVLTKLSWKSTVCIWGGPVAALWGLWELFIAQ
jgi:hypothetical protein